ILLLTCLIFATSLAHAVAVSGYITNMATKQPIPGASVNAGGKFAYADGNGWYQLVLSPGKYKFTVSGTGFLPASQQVNVLNDLKISVPLSTAGRIAGTVTDSGHMPM